MPIRPENRGRYPKDWKEISARIRFVRAEGRCECDGRCGVEHDGRCTAEHGKPHPVTGSRVTLTVAHLNHVPEEREDHQLMAMCERCHNRYDAPMRAAGRKSRAEQERARILDKAGQIAFELQCFGGSR